MDYNNPALTAKIRLLVDGSTTRKALELVRDFVTRAQCGSDAEAKLSIIVEEMVTNIVEHGAPPPDSEITIELSAIGTDIGLTLSDAGTFFDPRTADAPAELPPECGGGAGIALVLSWSRVISYARIDGRNVLTLVIPNDV
jgi:anti-sigma regulatory factor (Ser/Thr protein kinase)